MSRRMLRPHRTPPASLLWIALLVGACGESPPAPLASGAHASAGALAPSAPASGAASATGSAQPEPKDEVPWVGIPRTVEEVEKVINPRGGKPYAGPSGTLRGTITLKGDPPPDVKLDLKKECEAAAAVYGKAFRVDATGKLADALVTVTGYEGFVPVKAPAVQVTMKGCAYEQLAYSMTFGQRLEVSNLDPKLSHVPILDPAPFRAVNVALPKGNPIKLYAYQPAVNYVLRDYMSRTHVVARVFTLKYATHDVTDLEGRFEITGIPVGSVTVNAFLPSIEGDVAEKKIEIKEGDNTLDLELHFDTKKHKLAPLPADPWLRPGGTAEPSAGGFGAPPQLPPKSQVPR